MARLLDWIRRINASLPIFHKVVIANTALIAGVAVASTWAIIRRPYGGTVFAGPSVILAAAIGVSLAVNFLLMRLAFHPLFALRQLMDDISRGDHARRAPEKFNDPDVAHLVVTFNRMLDELARHRRSVSSQILRALEDERKRFARELHDETSQSLTNLVIRLDMAHESLRRAEADPEIREEIIRIRDQATRTLEETRRLTFDMRPTILDDLGLVPALRWYVKHKLEPMGIRVSMEVAGFDRRLSEDIETALFRIVQEALTNVMKHAAAEKVSLTLRQGSAALKALIVDDGVGFSMEEIDSRDPTGRGMGLFGMGERAELVGGTVNIASSPGQGTRVEVEIPYMLADEGGGRHG